MTAICIGLILRRLVFKETEEMNRTVGNVKQQRKINHRLSLERSILMPGGNSNLFQLHLDTLYKQSKYMTKRS